MQASNSIENAIVYVVLGTSKRKAIVYIVLGTQDRNWQADFKSRVS